MELAKLNKLFIEVQSQLVVKKAPSPTIDKFTEKVKYFRVSKIAIKKFYEQELAKANNWRLRYQELVKTLIKK